MGSGTSSSNPHPEQTRLSGRSAPASDPYPAQATAAAPSLNDGVLPRRSSSPAPRLHLGTVVITSNAASVLENHEVLAALGRHLRGDWGEVGSEDSSANERALVERTRVLSAYRSSDGVRFWIITEADRSLTTVLLPEDY